MNKYNPLNIALVFAGFLLGSFAISAFAWDNPPTLTPPGCDVSTHQGCNPPLNIGLSEQFKLGPISVNTNTTEPSVIGLSVGGKIKIVNNDIGPGKVLMDVEGNGIATWMDIESVNPGVSSCVEVYDSTGALGGKPYYTSIDVPAVCISDTGTGCIIKQEIFRGTSIIRTRYFDYVQDPTSGFWQSSHNRTGKAKNGDSTSLNVITVFGSEDNGYLLLRDDRVAFSTTGYSYPGEISSTKWSAYDRRGNVDGVGESAHKLYVCSVSGATENDTP